MKELATERLILRPARLEDAKEIFVTMRDKSTSDNVAFIDWPVTKAQAENWVASSRMPDFHDRVVGRLRNTEEMIGCVSFWIERGECEVGYWIGERYRGLGYGSQMVSNSIQRFQNRNNIGDFWATTAVNNIASIKILESIGFLNSKTINLEMKDGSFRPSYYFKKSYST